MLGSYEDCLPYLRSYVPNSPPEAKTVHTLETAPMTLNSTDDIQTIIAAVIKKAENDDGRKMAEINRAMNARMDKLEQSLGAIVTKVIEATYISLRTSGAFVTTDENVKLQADVTSMSSKLDAFIAAFNSNGNSAMNSPPRKLPRVDNNEILSSAPLIRDAAMSEREK